ncbi:MAG: hypothetical protein JWQ10_2993, partial [Herbaspirillum sp.]|nr:hypothetical protein [Herbaspirillum sp.]
MDISETVQQKSFIQNIGALGHRKCETIRLKRWIFLEIGEVQHRYLSEG